VSGCCDPVGSDEIARRLGVERATVHMWRVRRLLPEPEHVVSGRPCWHWATVERWARETGRLRD